MAEMREHRPDKWERTLLAALLLSAPGPLVTGSAAITSRSATQIADFVRRSAELVALFVSWWVYRRLQRNHAPDTAYRAHLERTTNLTVAGAMICSAIAMLILGVFRLYLYEANSDVAMGLVIAVLGLLVNSWFWWRYRSLTRERFDPVIAAQQGLYRAKACVDLCVVTALTAVAVAPNHPVTHYIDAFGCIIVAGYLLYSGVDMVRKTKTAGALSQTGEL